MREYAKQDAGLDTPVAPEHVRSAKEHFKKYTDDPEAMEKALELAGAEAGARKILGEGIWTLYRATWEKKWQAVQDRRVQEEERIEAEAEYAGEYTQKIKESYRAFLNEAMEAVISELRMEQGQGGIAQLTRAAVGPINERAVELYMLGIDSEER